MGTKRKINWKSTSGLLSLEASIALTIFLFLMLYLYSFLVIFEARNQIAHTLLTTADSMALDAFANEAPDSDSVQGLLYGLYGKVSSSNGVFTNTGKWYDGSADGLQAAVKSRFLAYLSGGNEEEAKKILDSLNVVGGIDGLDFSESHVSGNDLFLEVRYTLEYEFKVFGFDTIEFSQTCCSKIWKE